MKNPIVELVAKEMASFNSIWVEDRARPHGRRIFPEKTNLYPIPFFGDIRRAEVVTVALNPSHAEFTSERWAANTEPTALTPDGLTNRLLSYFHTQRHDPHELFESCERGLLALGCSYKRNAAHIDIHSFPTKRAHERNDDETGLLARTIQEQSANHLTSVLSLFQQLKLMVVVDFSVPLVGGGHLTTFDYVRERLPALAGLVDMNGFEPPLIRGGNYKGIGHYLFEHRSRLQSFLDTAPSLIFCS